MRIYLFAFLVCFSVGHTSAQTGASKKTRLAIDTVKTTTPSTADARSSWSFLSLGACGVDVFLKDHPTFDGRGTIIAVLDDGVDPGLLGLLETSDGKRKMLDVQDFSGTGDLTYQTAERRGDELYFNGKKVLNGLDKKNINSVGNKYFYAVLNETRFKNGLSDINFNDKKDDTFGVVVFEDATNHFSAIVDADGDGDLTDESIVTNFKEHGDLYRLRSPKNSSLKDERFLSGAVNIFPDEHRINLYLADGGHGTHVAGIAGGCNIDGQQGFNGVAPGAQMVAVKFSDNINGGVTVTNSMKRAYEYVVGLAKETGKPVIANMSFGIGSEIEGRSIMDEWLDSLLDAHPEVTVCIAAGNEGPGISNIGLPGTARSVITSAAALPYDTGRDLYGLKMTKTIIWDFSSRGAELAKPDIASPGTAISTVPDYVTHDRYNGTSMASPYTTGCCAVLASAMLQSFSGYVPNAVAIKRALQLGAVHIENMTPLDEGAGLVNVPKAFEQLSIWQRDHIPPTQYLIKVPVPNTVGYGTAAYYRNGYYPKSGDRTTFQITPLDEKKDNSRSSKLGFHAFELVSASPWIEPIQTSIYRRGDGALEASVRYDEQQLKVPGMYVGKVLAYKKGAPRKNPEFELWNTVIIPNELTQTQNYTAEIKNIPVKSGYLSRQFFRMPPSTKAVEITLSGDEGASNTDAIIVDNDGKTFDAVRLKPKDGVEEKSRWISAEDLREGIWEIIVKRGLGSDDENPSVVTLKVQAYPMDITDATFSATPEAGMNGRFNLTNHTTTVFEIGKPTAQILGYGRTIDTTISSGDTYMLMIAPRKGEHRASFDVTLDRKDYNLFTDISLQILKPDSSTAFGGAFDFRESSAHVTFATNDSLTYLLKFKGGLADAAKPHMFKLHIQERREFFEAKTTLQAEMDKSSKLLNPGSPETFTFNKKIESTLPKGYNFYGRLRFDLSGLDRNDFDIPIVFAR